MRGEISGQSTLKTTAKSAALGLVFTLVATAAPDFSGPHDAGLMAEPREREASGLAPSRRVDDLYWTHNDSGTEPLLHGVDRAGHSRGTVRLHGVKSEDWEDLASFELDGRAWLLVADCGDNFSSRPRGVLHVVAEPPLPSGGPATEVGATPAYSIHFIFEDGARDCEAVAVDPVERMVWLLTKRDEPARLYRLPLVPAGPREPAAARFAGTVPALADPHPGLRRRLLPAALKMGRWPTALDFSPDGRLALVLTLEGLVVFPRAANESWADALARTPVRLGRHTLPQAEAGCFSADGRSIFVSSEQTRRWMRYDRR